MEDRALSFHPKEVATLRALDHQALCRAREEVGDHRVDRDPPARDRDPGLPGRNEDRFQASLAGLEVELAGRGHLPDRTVGTDGQDDRRVNFEICSGRRAQVRGRFAQIAQLDAMPLGELR